MKTSNGCNSILYRGIDQCYHIKPDLLCDLKTRMLYGVNLKSYDSKPFEDINLFLARLNAQRLEDGSIIIPSS